MKFVYALALVAIIATGCTIVSQNRTFPKPAWYWSQDAQIEREARQQEKLYEASLATNSPSK